MSYVMHELAQLKKRAADAESELGRALVRLKTGESGLFFERADDIVIVHVAGMGGEGGAPTALSPVASALVFEAVTDLADLLIERAQAKSRELVKLKAAELKGELETEAARVRKAEADLAEFLK